MDKSIGLLEFNSIAKGVEATDAMLKAAAVELLFASTTCPGKYFSMITGEVSAVKSAIEAGKKIAFPNLVDDFIIPNVHNSVISAMTGTTDVILNNALGIIETMSAASCIEAADIAVKTAAVELISVRMPTGLGGKSFCSFTGEVSAVKASVESGANLVKEKGLLIGKVVIPSPHKELAKKIV